MPADAAALKPAQARSLFRAGSYSGPTSGFCDGYSQANLVILPETAADAFEAYCAANPRPCPLIERLIAGNPEPRRSAPEADLRTDLPRYRRYRPTGASDEHEDILPLWRDHAVGFLLGCSFSFEAALARAGVPLRHQEEERNVPMFRTKRATLAVGPFAAPLVVSMRPVPAEQVEAAYRITAPYQNAHGAPIHHGAPADLGIGDLARPDWGDPVTVRPEEVPVFWACGVTSQLAVVEALRRQAIDWAITHAPGHMFITDLPATASLA